MRPKRYSKRYTDEQFAEAVRTSRSIRQVLIKIGLKPMGGNYSSCMNHIKLLELDMSHFTQSGWSKGMKIGPKRPLKEYLDNQHPIQSHKLRQRLLVENVLEKKCSCCGLTTWMNQDVPLELDHIDGNHDNNRLENLRMLCPNCHALTPNYRGKNIGKGGGSRTHT